MATNYLMESTTEAGCTVELMFAGDGVALAGQIDYPTHRVSPSQSIPLLFILPHSGCNTREAYAHYAETALHAGFAVFRWDKRGTGRSGAGGRGSTTQDAANAYETALEQPGIARDSVVILAQSEGTLMLGSSYGLFARLQRPCGVILAGNMLDEKSILAIDTPIQIILGTADWKDPRVYARDAAHAHNIAYPNTATYYIAESANRRLLIEQGDHLTFHSGAQDAMQSWLKSLRRAVV